MRKIKVMELFNMVSLILSPVVFEYISLKDVEVAKKDTFVGNTVLVMITKDKKIYRCRAEEKQIKDLKNLL